MEELETKLMEKFGEFTTLQYNGTDLPDGKIPPIEITGRLTNLRSGKFTIVNENNIYPNLAISEIEENSIV
jgi:hypothetical protein